jgi:hypothetical protein
VWVWFIDLDPDPTETQNQPTLVWSVVIAMGEGDAQHLTIPHRTVLFLHRTVLFFMTLTCLWGGRFYSLILHG